MLRLHLAPLIIIDRSSLQVSPSYNKKLVTNHATLEAIGFRPLFRRFSPADGRIGIPYRIWNSLKVNVCFPMGLVVFRRRMP